MERSASGATEPSRPSGRPSERFSEVVSQGPTPIPDNDVVSAAISSVLTVDDTAVVQPSDRLRQATGAQAGPVLVTPEVAAAGALLDNAIPPATTTNAPDNNNINSINNNNSRSKNTVGRRRSIRIEHPAVNLSGAASTVAGARGDGSVSGSGGGLLDWALWPLWSTIDALKWAGGTVNEVAVAPVIRLASPWGLAGSMLTTVKAFTPQRARDLARVVGNGVLNFVGLARTPAGGALLQSSGKAAGSFRKAVSSPAARQLLVDSATGFVKLAEALDTPEAKNAIQQGAVVMARGMDALGSRHSKMMVKDLANVAVRFVELATSAEATTLAAELTANMVHALEMEHIGGGDPNQTFTEAASAAAEHDKGGNVEVAGDEGGEARRRDQENAVDNADTNDDAQGVTDNLMAPGLAAMEASGHRHRGDEASTMGEAILGASRDQARPDNETAKSAVSETSAVANGDTDGGNDDGLGDGDARQMTLTMDNSPTVGGGSDETGEPSAASALTGSMLPRRSDHINPTPIRQSDLTGGVPLHMIGGEHPGGVNAMIPPLGRRVKRSSVSSICSATDVSRSAPPSPSGRRRSSMSQGFAESGRPALCEGGGSTRGRVRASSATGASGCGINGGRRTESSPGSGSLDDSVARQSQSQTGASKASENGVGVDSAAGSEVESGAGTGGGIIASYVRDGRAVLPRFSAEAFLSVLRGKPLSLEQQLEAPNDKSFVQNLTRAAKDSLTRWAPAYRATAAAGDEPLAVGGQEKGTEARGRNAAAGTRGQELGRGGVLRRPTSQQRAGLMNMVFALLLLALAGDGLRHRCKKLFGRASESNRGPEGSGSVVDVGGAGADSAVGGGEPDSRYRAAFLPPTCQDRTSGAVMAVWVTPSGPCLLPIGKEGGWFGGAEGGGGPGCAASFRLCSEQEVVGSREE